MDYRKHVLVYLHGSAREWCMQLLHFSLHGDNRVPKASADDNLVYAGQQCYLS